MSATISQSRVARRVILTAFLSTTPGLAVAQDDYPNRAIKIIAPVAAGIVADAVPRLIADKLAVRWGHAVIVENRPGGATNIDGGVSERCEAGRQVPEAVDNRSPGS